MYIVYTLFKHKLNDSNSLQAAKVILGEKRSCSPEQLVGLNMIRKILYEKTTEYYKEYM
jgi:hypothetical protein